SRSQRTRGWHSTVRSRRRSGSFLRGAALFELGHMIFRIIEVKMRLEARSIRLNAEVEIFMQDGEGHDSEHEHAQNPKNQPLHYSQDVLPSNLLDQLVS